MIAKLRTLLLLVAGGIHLLPVAGLAGRARLESLYGIELPGADLLVLMQHRAVLFLLLGAFLCAAAFRPRWQAAAVAVGLVSAGSFLLIAAAAGEVGPAVARVVVADVVAVACLAVTGVLLAVRKPA